MTARFLALDETPVDPDAFDRHDCDVHTSQSRNDCPACGATS